MHVLMFVCACVCVRGELSVTCASLVEACVSCTCVGACMRACVRRTASAEHLLSDHMASFGLPRVVIASCNERVSVCVECVCEVRRECVS